VSRLTEIPVNLPALYDSLLLAADSLPACCGGSRPWVTQRRG